MICHESTSRIDNLAYGIGKDTANNGHPPNLEAGTYEVPVSSSASASAGTVTQDAKTEPEYEVTESAYAVPHVYEYAILGPNEQKVIICITLNCQCSGWLITVSTSGINSAA